MAAYDDVIEQWRFGLNSHPLFEKLRSGQSHRQDESKIQPEGLMLIKEGQMFVWDNDAARLLTANLRDLLVKDQSLNTLQTLLCISAPVFDVERLVSSSAGQHVLLHGKRGASVLELPRRHGKHGLFEGGKAQINCRVTPIAERFFISNTSVCLLEAAWHPGSESDTHIALLTSDNVFRIYDICNPLKPIQTHRLGSHTTSYAVSSSHSTFDAVLGEIAVSFDFGPPSEVPMNMASRSEESNNWVYPVFVLRGNGDVYVLKTSLTDVRYMHTKLQGPLPMHPPAEDNYGLDACSICCLPSDPPVLIVATSSGLLHHCIQVVGEADDDDDISSIQSSTVSSMTLVAGTTNYSLYVYETVELARSPVISEDYDNDVTYPIMLHSDPSCSRRYFCSHSGGVHGILLPWLEKLDRFCTSGDDDESQLEVSQDQPCNVIHMICTMPSETCPPSPITGLAIVMDQLLGNILMCLTQSRECMATPLPLIEASIPPSLISEEPSQESVVSPLRQLRQEPFQQYIKRLLQRNNSNPILKTSAKTSLNLDECFQLLLQATKTLREEYIHKQDLVKEEIEKRDKILKQQKNQQLSDIAECQQLKSEISNKAAELAERYDDAEEKQEELLNRVGVVLHTLHSELPILSEAEQGMRSELKSLQQKLDLLKNSLQQVKAKQTYQQKHVDKQELSPTPALSQNRQKHLKSLLQDETAEISSLISEVKNLSVAVVP